MKGTPAGVPFFCLLPPRAFLTPKREPLYSDCRPAGLSTGGTCQTDAWAGYPMKPHKLIPVALLVMALMVGLAACQTTGRADERTPAVTALAELTATPPAGPTDIPPQPTAPPAGSDTTIAPRSQSCNHSATLEENVTIPDDTVLLPGTSFIKTWRIRNSGNCLWEPGTVWYFAGGEQMNARDEVEVAVTAPRQTVDISVGFLAPRTPGRYVGYWKLRMTDGTVPEAVFQVQIIVAGEGSEAATPVPPAPSPTSGPQQPPAGATPIPPTDIPPAAPGATPVPDGWFGEYFNNPTLNGSPLVTRVDPDINFDWGTGAPMQYMPSNRFSVRWTRRLPFEEGVYRFFARSDDGVRVWVDGRLVIDEWHTVQDRTYQADVALTTGLHDFRVEYFEEIQLANVSFWWDQQGAFANWRGEYFSNQFLSGDPVLVRDDRAVAFNWGLGSPAGNLPKDNFSVRWTRAIEFRSAGTYTFNAIVDDGIRLFVNNVLVIDEWRDGNQRQVSGSVALPAGTHFVRVEYYENVLDAAVWLWWGTGEQFSDWRGEYWNNRSLDGEPVLVRNDLAVNFNWEFGSPDPSLPADYFSARWARFQTFERGVYRLSVRVDDGVRVYIDGDRVMDYWYESSADQLYTTDLVLEGTHSIVVIYFENTLLASIDFRIERIGNAPQ